MAKRDLLFLDDLASHLVGFDPNASEGKSRAFLTQLHATLIAKQSILRNRLDRLTAHSPDLLDVIKAPVTA